MERVAIIGAGEIGKAIAHVIGRKADAGMWDKDSTQVPGQMKPLEEVLRSTSIVFICVPSWAVREVAVQVAPLIQRNTTVVSLAKGIEQGSLKTMDAVLKESFPTEQPISILGGPLLAGELFMNLPGIGVLASDNQIVFDAIHPLFKGTNIRLEYEADMHSVALASTLKNIYAVGLGIVEGLGWGWNGKGWLASRSIQEMARAVRTFGGDAEIISGPVGTGDLIATGMSPDSHNRMAGLEIARTGVVSTPSEGCRSLRAVSKMLDKSLADLPILQALRHVVIKGDSAKNVFSDLLT